MRFSAYAWKPSDLVGGDPAVDFVNTASEWSKEPVDRLGGFSGLADWALVAGVLTEEEAAAAREAAARRPDEANRIFEGAAALRESLWRLFHAAAHDRRADTADLHRLKDWTRRAACYLCLEQTAGGFEETWSADAPPLEIAIFRIARAAERLLTEGRLDRLHACGGETCEWMFLDLSKNGSRRWCSMSTCGNDAKVKKFRRRKTSAIS